MIFRSSRTWTCIRKSVMWRFCASCKKAACLMVRPSRWIRGRRDSRRASVPGRTVARARPRVSRQAVALGWAGLALLTSSAWTVPAIRLTPEQRARRAERIAAMSEAERARLERNFRRWLQLKAEQRQAFRKLHQKIGQDPALKQTLDRYVEWLQTLSPWERAELRKISDPRKRLQRVEQYRKELSSQDEELGFPSEGPFARTPVRPTAKDFEAMMQVLERRLTIPPARRAALEKLSGVERHLAVLETSVRQAGLDPGLRPGLRRPSWPDPVTCEKLIDAMPTRELAAIFRRLNDEQRRRA
ncbi:MAG TPA: DUF3106 domain-containing protein, partial [Planctomycetaceae bacterium]|nr:DUF3106 domain-containing protein [Planctomycetaceae bacterium]